MNFNAKMQVEQAIADVYEVVGEYYNGEFTDDTKFSEVAPSDAEAREQFEQELNKALRSLYNAAAGDCYLEHTKKSFEQLSADGYFSYGKNCWADCIHGGMFQTVSDCINAAVTCAENQCDLEEERTRENDI